MTPDTVHDTVLVFSKTWGAIYLLTVFIGAAIWTYLPRHKTIYQDAAQSPLGDEEITR